jgi:hypothetical protein
VHSRQTLQGAAASTASSSTALTATSTTTASTTATATAAATTAQTSAAVTQGPVGQPSPTPENAGGPTPYTYTTTDANGNYITVVATFTPSFAKTTPYTPTGSGTIIQYSQWLSMVGSNSGAPAASQGANSASRMDVNIGLLLGAISTALIYVLGRSLVGLV